MSQLKELLTEEMQDLLHAEMQLKSHSEDGGSGS
jgi:hypothetical protein